MRMLMTTDAVGGVWTYATELAAALVPFGVETMLCNLGPAPTPAQRGAVDRTQGVTLIDTGLPLDWLCDGPLPVRAAGRAVADMAQSYRVDVVHLNMPTLAASARFPAPVVAVAHGCVATWWAAAKATPLIADYRWQRLLMREGLARADAVVAPSAAYAATIARTYGLAQAPLVVHNGRLPLATRATARPGDVFTAGRLWDSVKNTALLDTVAARLPVPFRAAGPSIGPHGETIPVRHLDLLGNLDTHALAAELSARPVFVSAATFEPFGLAVLEAAMAGCPLVLSGIDTFRELWDGAALFVESDDPADYACAIESVLADPALRGWLGAAAQTRATRYTPATTAAAMAGQYDGLLAPARRGGGVRIVYFTHSLRSCWNHGNAHFMRGVLRELIARGHDVAALEPEGAWSLANLLSDAGHAGLAPFEAAYPELKPVVFDPAQDLAPLIEGADVVIVHEWNDPALVAEVGRLRARGGTFRLLFHDTHHRAVSDPDAIRAFDLSGYDGVLAFGETLSEVYRRWGWQGRVWTWHEAADTRLFHPPATEGTREGLVWIGNWGDGERTQEIEDFLLRPAQAAALPLDIYGVRYPDEAKALLARHGARYHGWAPNAAAPAIFARHLATVHVPRRYYATILPGIPTIRVFEALACGIPLVSAPWDDAEHLFRPGADYLVASDGEAMTRHLAALRDDPDRRAALVASGLETIRARHTCAHRADELLAVIAKLSPERTLA